MTRILVLAFSYMIFFVSCKTSNKFNFPTEQEKIALIMQCDDLNIFYNVRIQNRGVDSQKKVQSFHVGKTIGDSSFWLLNYKRYGCDFDDLDCISDMDSSNSIIENYSAFIKTFQETSSLNQNYTASEYLEKVFNEYESFYIHRILSDTSRIGDCIIFSITEKRFLAFVNDNDKIYNKFWKEKFTQENFLEDKWYLGDM